VSQIAQASSVLLTRGPDPLEVFVVRRAATLRFFGGFLVFPGGSAAPDDVAVEVASASPEPPVRIVTAARELF
jgi:8-oxo-dGTP pyrophosphatase MutT (NUDIX family)